ncbi:MAG: SCP2 sterol-binding domain-containing protein [Methylobacillus sp.]|jgi:predicted lipid carrier protein YhbT|nr:SCP2 sterol-binding domain-containing protein [Methylobacillus sp.]
MNFPQLRFPAAAARVIARLPVLPPSFVLARLLNLALKHAIARQDFQPLHHKRIAIRVSDTGLQAHFTVDEKGFRAISKTAQPDLTFVATAHDYTLLATRREDPDALFFSRRLLIEGDTELALIAKNTLDGLELPEWMQRPPLPGDLLAKFR